MSSPSPTSPLRFAEKVAYGCGNFFPTLVTATAGMAMFFYTDVVGLSAALIGTVLLLVRLADALWDIYVGRWVDRTRTRWGQGRPFLLWSAPLVAVAYVLAFTVPPFEGQGAKLAMVVACYVALWWGYSLVNIPFQSMPALVAPDPDERLKLLGVNAFVLFVTVVVCGAGFPKLKDVLGQGASAAQGFQQAAMVYGVLGLLMTWVTFAVVRERVPPAPVQRPDLKRDLGFLAASRAWRAALVSFALLALLIGLPLSAGVYYFAGVLKAPQLIGPFMGLSGLGLMVGVVLSGRLTARFCKKQVMVWSTVAMGLLSLAYLLVWGLAPTWSIAVAFASNLMLGIGAPVSQSLLADTADSIELNTGHRVVGTLFASINFGQKIGAGLAGAVVGWALSSTGYVAGAAAQPELAQWGIVGLMGPLTALVAFGVAAGIGLGYPIDRQELARVRDGLAARRESPQPA